MKRIVSTLIPTVLIPVLGTFLALGVLELAVRAFPTHAPARPVERPTKPVFRTRLSEDVPRVSP